MPVVTKSARLVLLVSAHFASPDASLILSPEEEVAHISFLAEALALATEPFTEPVGENLAVLAYSLVERDFSCVSCPVLRGCLEAQLAA
jgi:hypothetical protein